MSKKLAAGLDALVLDVKVGAGAFMKKQVDARRLAQMMVGIGRRMGNKRVQALITDMDQPLGYAIGNALEVMEVSQTLQNVGPVDLHELSLELAARMIYLGRKRNRSTRRESLRRRRSARWLGLPQVQGSDRSAGRQSAGAGPVRTAAERHRRCARFSARAPATSARSTPRTSACASTMIGAGRDRKEDTIDPAVGVILEAKVGQKIDAGSVLCRIYYTREDTDDAVE